MNSPISNEEIMGAIKVLKCGKSAGPDNLFPEFFIVCGDRILPLLNKLFNKIFEDWSKSILIPLHKKGSFDEPGNYRGICLSDICSKLFTRVLNRRLSLYTTIYDKVSEV